ncbi:MAG: STAS domain-containing protein [Acidobacteria bacterium]|nr:STAS domain-containing protein [Acidobacteriota bacterium]
MPPVTKAKDEQIRTAQGAPTTVMRLEGDITSASKEAVLGTYQGLAKDSVKSILLDFTKVEYLNSSGIALIIQLMMESSKSGQSVRCFGLSAHFQKVFTMLGLTKYTSLHSDEPAAKAAFA